MMTLDDGEGSHLGATRGLGFLSGRSRHSRRPNLARPRGTDR